MYFRDLWASVGQFTTATLVDSTVVSPFPLKDWGQETVSTFHKSTSTDGLKTTRILIDILRFPQRPSGFERYEPLSPITAGRLAVKTEQRGRVLHLQCRSLLLLDVPDTTVSQSCKVKSWNPKTGIRINIKKPEAIWSCCPWSYPLPSLVLYKIVKYVKQ